VSHVAEIAAFLSLADGGLSFETLGRAIRMRWPEASVAEVEEALVRAARGAPDDAERAALFCAAAAILGRRGANKANVFKSIEAPDDAVRAPFR
jgi:hypothetical protein